MVIGGMCSCSSPLVFITENEGGMVVAGFKLCGFGLGQCGSVGWDSLYRFRTMGHGGTGHRLWLMFWGGYGAISPLSATS